MKSLQEIWEDLKKYLEVEKALELGFSNGNYTKELAKYAKKVVGIDISDDFMEIAKRNLKDYSNIELLIMDANNMSFEDKSFYLVLSTSFHEFDLSGEEYSVDLELKRSILTEMARVSDTIVFIEPTENAVTNELFKVFNPNENHSDRIKQSNNLIDTFMKEKNYELVTKGLTYNKDQFSNLDELNEEMLDWWADIKVPSTEEEKKQMINQIDMILDNAGMLEGLYVTEEIAYKVFKKVN